jgi:hypothetical protein
MENLLAIRNISGISLLRIRLLKTTRTTKASVSYYLMDPLKSPSMSPITPRASSPAPPYHHSSLDSSSSEPPVPRSSATARNLSSTARGPFGDVLPRPSKTGPSRGNSLPKTLASASFLKDASFEARAPVPPSRILSYNTAHENDSRLEPTAEVSRPGKSVSQKLPNILRKQAEIGSVSSVITGMDANGRHVSLLNQSPKIGSKAQGGGNTMTMISDEKDELLSPASKKRKVEHEHTFTSATGTQYTSPYALPVEETSNNHGLKIINTAPFHPTTSSLRPLQPAPPKTRQQGRMSSAASSSHVLKRPQKREPKRAASPSAPALHTWKPHASMATKREEKAPTINQATRDFFAKYEEPKQGRNSLPPDFTFNPPQARPRPRNIGAQATSRPSSGSGHPIPPHASSRLIHPGSHPPRTTKSHDSPDFSDDEAPIILGFEQPLEASKRVERLQTEIEALLLDAKKVKTERDYFKTRKDVYKGQLRERETMFRTQRQFVESLQKQLLDAKDKIQVMEGSMLSREK